MVKAPNLYPDKITVNNIRVKILPLAPRPPDYTSVTSVAPDATSITCTLAVAGCAGAVVPWSGFITWKAQLSFAG